MEKAPHLSLKKTRKLRAKQGLIQNNSETLPLFVSAVNCDLISRRHFLAADKEKTINNKLEVKIIPALDKGADGNHKMPGQGMISPGKLFNNSRGTAKDNTRKAIHFKNPEVVILVDFNVLSHAHGQCRSFFPVNINQTGVPEKPKVFLRLLIK